MSVALPVEEALGTAGRILEAGDISPGFLGVRVVSLSPAGRRELGDTSLVGVLVTDVVPASPAESAGIRPGDVITAFGTEPARSVAGLRDAVVTSTPGDRVEITYMRKRELLSETVVIGRHGPETARVMTEELQAGLDPEALEARVNRLKSEIQSLKAQLRELEAQAE
jgi:S1-C subfamily serine protease